MPIDVWSLYWLFNIITFFGVTTLFLAFFLILFIVLLFITSARYIKNLYTTGLSTNQLNFFFIFNYGFVSFFFFASFLDFFKVNLCLISSECYATFLFILWFFYKNKTFSLFINFYNLILKKNYSTKLEWFLARFKNVTWYLMLILLIFLIYLVVYHYYFIFSIFFVKQLCQWYIIICSILVYYILYKKIFSPKKKIIWSSWLLEEGTLLNLVINFFYSAAITYSPSLIYTINENKNKKITDQIKNIVIVIIDYLIILYCLNSPMAIYILIYLMFITLFLKDLTHYREKINFIDISWVEFLKFIYLFKNYRFLYLNFEKNKEVDIYFYEEHT